jgi:hypothetical protein
MIFLPGPCPHSTSSYPPYCQYILHCFFMFSLTFSSTQGPAWYASSAHIAISTPYGTDILNPFHLPLSTIQFLILIQCTWSPPLHFLFIYVPLLRDADKLWVKDLPFVYLSAMALSGLAGPPHTSSFITNNSAIEFYCLLLFVLLIEKKKVYSYIITQQWRGQIQI